MPSGIKAPKKCLNPNWDQLREKLKDNISKNRFPEHGRKVERAEERSVLGKRKDRLDEESSQALKKIPLIPSSSDCSLTDAVAMDCEMVGVSFLGNKSALGRVTIVNEFGNVLVDEYVRPMDHIVDFRTGISGIRPRDLRKAKNFNDVQKEVANTIKGRVLVGHALHNDLKALLMSHPKKDIRDTSAYRPLMKDGRSRSLKALAEEFLGVEIQNGVHCPIEDARAAMMLYQMNRKEWERSKKDFIRLKVKQRKRKLKNELKEAAEKLIKN